jgi:hypothetical protein
VSSVFSSIAGSYDYVLGQYGTYAPQPATPELNTLQEVDAGCGYMIRMTRAAALSLSGTRVEVSTPIELPEAGWHWIGFLAAEPAGPPAALDSLTIPDGGFKYAYLMGEPGTFVPPPALQFLNNLTSMEPGRGYLIRMNEPGSVIYSAPTPP